MKTPLPVIIVLAAVAWVAAWVVVCIYTTLVELRNRFKTPARKWTCNASSVIERAFRTSAPHLGAKADGLQLLPRAECGLRQLDTAFDRLTLALPQIKRNVIESCRQLVGADGLIQEREAEWLRAIAETPDGPIAPFVECRESESVEVRPKLI